MEGDAYIQRLATHIRRNEEALANGLLYFSKARTASKVKPQRLALTIHHLYYVTEKIEASNFGVDVGPLNIKLDTPNHEPTFISFLANNARSLRQFDSDARSVTSINSVRSIVSSASVYWRLMALSKDPKIVSRDMRYLYSSFTKLPCLILNPKTKVSSISGYEEYPCDTSVPLKMFKNLQVLELVEYEPNEVYGWHVLSEQLRILILRNNKISDLAEVMFQLVVDDENGRSSFNSRGRKHEEFVEKKSSKKRDRAHTLASIREPAKLSNNDQKLQDNKWTHLRQLTVTESSIQSIQRRVFLPMVNLVKLNLSNNLLEDVPPGLDLLVNVKYVNLADNYIASLANLPSNLLHLIALNLNNNKIEDISGMEHLVSLEKVDLRKNKLKDMKLLKPLVQLVAQRLARLTNVYLIGNPLPKAYRVELFNLFNGARPKNTLRIDDSRPGYFESAILLDLEGARKLFERFIRGDAKESLQVNSPTQELGHRHTSSAVDALESLSIHENEKAGTRKHLSVITTAFTTSAISPSVPHIDDAVSLLPSPSTFSLRATIMPLRASQTFNKHPPKIGKQPLALPMMHHSNNGSTTTLKSSNTITRLDLEAAPTTAPSVITPVQVQVEGFK